MTHHPELFLSTNDAAALHVLVGQRRHAQGPESEAVQALQDLLEEAELLPQVFELFVQGRQAIDRQGGGLGLGLAIVRAMVRMHGGEVVAHSDGPGRGARFTVRRPARAHPGRRRQRGRGRNARRPPAGDGL